MSSLVLRTVVSDKMFVIYFFLVYLFNVSFFSLVYDQIASSSFSISILATMCQFCLFICLFSTLNIACLGFSGFLGSVVHFPLFLEKFWPLFHKIFLHPSLSFLSFCNTNCSDDGAIIYYLILWFVLVLFCLFIISFFFVLCICMF